MALHTTFYEDAARLVRIGRVQQTVTAAQFTIAVGFDPKYVRGSNVSERVDIEWFNGMSQNTALKTVAAGTRTQITALGVISSDRVVSFGLDTDLLPTPNASTDGNLIEFIVIG